MVLRVFKYGEKVLREKAVPVPVVTDAMRRRTFFSLSHFANSPRNIICPVVLYSGVMT